MSVIYLNRIVLIDSCQAKPAMKFHDLSFLCCESSTTPAHLATRSRVLNCNHRICENCHTEALLSKNMMCPVDGCDKTITPLYPLPPIQLYNSTSVAGFSQWHKSVEERQKLSLHEYIRLKCKHSEHGCKEMYLFDEEGIFEKEHLKSCVSDECNCDQLNVFHQHHSLTTSKHIQHWDKKARKCFRKIRATQLTITRKGKESNINQTTEKTNTSQTNKRVHEEDVYDKPPKLMKIDESMLPFLSINQNDTPFEQDFKEPPILPSLNQFIQNECDEVQNSPFHSVFINS